MIKVYRNFGILAALAQAGCVFLIAQQRYGLVSTDEKHQESTRQLLIWITHLILPVFLVAGKRVEGWNLSFFPNVFCTLTMIFAIRFSSISFIFYPMIVFATFFLVVHIVALKAFCYTKFIEPKGSFRVGFKYLKYKELAISVYYPTDKPSGNGAPYYQDSYPLDNLYIFMTFGRPFPRAIFDIMYDFQTKIKQLAHLDSPLISPEKLASQTTSSKFVPIIFSPGLGSHRSAYSNFCTEFASRGHIVVSLNHIEDIKETFIEKGTELKTKYLAKRVHEVRGLIDSLQQGHLLSEVFKSEVPLAMEKTIVIGHSFGGATALTTALEDKRVNDIILLDPWFFAMKKEDLSKKLHCGAFLIESDYWDASTSMFEIRARNKEFINAQKENEKKAIYTIAKRSDHITFGDSAVTNAAYLSLFKLITHKEEQRGLLALLVEIASKYVEVSVSGAKKDEVDKFMQMIKTSKKLTYE